MQLSESEKLKILDFIATCDDFSNGKFLLIDSKINNILKKISESDAICNLIENTLQNYNFDKEFSHSQIKFIGKPAKFEVPSDPVKLIPLVYCMLVKIQDKSLDFSEFLKTFYFDETDDFKKFTNEVIIPFKNTISAIFEINNMNNSIFDSNKLFPIKEEGEVMDNIEEINNDFSDVFVELQKLLNDILTEIDYNTKIKHDLKENAYILLEAMIEACEMKNLRILNGLIVGFEYIAPQIKNIKFLYKEFKQVLLKFYE